MRRVLRETQAEVSTKAGRGRWVAPSTGSLSATPACRLTTPPLPRPSLWITCPENGPHNGYYVNYGPKVLIHKGM